MERSSKIFVAGHRGLVGSALVRRLESKGFHNLVTRARDELDLKSQAAVSAFFEEERPEYVFLAAAKVGGILANSNFPAEFIFENLAIQINVIHAAYTVGVKRLLFLGSSCIYPRDCPQPIKEEYLLTGPLESSNRPYAVAKIAGIEQCWSYNRQYGTEFLAVMPTNLYGPGDNYHPQNSHVVPALIRRFHEAKVASAPSVTIWGTGTPRREFLYVDDMADACIEILCLPPSTYKELLASDRQEGMPPILNIGVGEDMTIAQLAAMVSDVVGYTGTVEFDSNRPDGTPRKLLDSSRLGALGIHPGTTMKDGLRNAYQDFKRRLCL